MTIDPSQYTTHAAIYVNPDKRILSPDPKVNGTLQPIPPRIRGMEWERIERGESRYTPAFGAALLSESAWKPVEDPPVPVERARAAVEYGEKCPWCNRSRQPLRAQ